MNIALPALVFLYLTVPGFLLVQSYHGRLGRKASDPAYPVTLTSGLFWAATLAPLIHLGLIPIVAWVTGYKPDYPTIFWLLAGEYGNDSAFSKASSSVVEHPFRVAGYFMLSAGIAILIGSLAHRLVRKCRLDVKIPVLRFPNRWHYVFSGELTETMPAGVLITTTIHHPEGGYLYVGVLSHYETDRHGDLVRLELKNVHRRAITADRGPNQEQEKLGESARYYKITGHVFVVWCKDVQTLNVKYLYEG